MAINQTLSWQVSQQDKNGLIEEKKYCGIIDENIGPNLKYELANKKT